MPVSTATLLDNKSSSMQNGLRPTYRATLLQSCDNELLSAEYIYGYFDQENNTKTLDRLRSCRTGAFFFRNRSTGAIRVGAQSCHLRHCPICTKSRELNIKTNVTSWLKTARFAKIVTFTLKHKDDSILEQLDKLYDAFRNIRRSNLMKKTCYGGVWFFQVKKSKDDHLWHPHIHCLVAGAYIPQKKLSQAWLKITGDSKIVDVRLVKNIETAAKDVARYAAKPCILSKLSLDECLELAIAIDKRRLCGTWGQCRKLKLTASPEIDKENWYRLASWSAVFENLSVDENARAIMNAWKTGQPLPLGVNIDYLIKPELFDVDGGERAPPVIDSQIYIDWKV